MAENSSNPDLIKAEQERVVGNYDKAINLLLKVGSEHPELRFQLVSQAIDLYGNRPHVLKEISEKTCRRVVDAILDHIGSDSVPASWWDQTFKISDQILQGSAYQDKEKGDIYNKFAGRLSSLSSLQTGEAYSRAGEFYLLIHNYRAARDAFSYTGNNQKILDLYWTEVKVLLSSMEYDEVISRFDEMVIWNNETRLVDQFDMFRDWNSLVLRTLESLESADNLSRIKKGFDREVFVLKLQKSVWSFAKEVKTANADIFEPLFQYGTRNSFVEVLDFLIGEMFALSLYSPTKHTFIVEELISNLEIGKVSTLVPLLIKRLAASTETLIAVEKVLEKRTQEFIVKEDLLRLLNQLVFLTSYLREPFKTIWWRIQRAVVHYELDQPERGQQDLIDAVKSTKGNKDFTYTIGEPILKLAESLASTKQFEESHKAFEHLAALYKSVDDIQSAGNVFGQQIKLFYKYGEKSSPILLQNALQMFTGKELLPIQGLLKQRAGEGLVEAGNDEEALMFFGEAQELYKEADTSAQGASLGEYLEATTRILLVDRRRRKHYSAYASLTENVYDAWGQADKLSRTLVFELMRLVASKAEAEAIVEMAAKVGRRLHNADDIRQYAYGLRDYSSDLLEKNDSVHAGEIGRILLTTLDQHSQGGLIKELGMAIALIFFNAKEPIIATDLLEKAITEFEKEGGYQEVAQALLQAGITLGRAELHSQAIATIGRSISYFEDAGNTGGIEAAIIQLLNISRRLSDKGMDEAQLYISKANSIMQQTGIMLEGTEVEKTYSAYSDHLINKSAAIVKDAFSPRRKHQKRQFFKKKAEKE